VAAQTEVEDPVKPARALLLTLALAVPPAFAELRVFVVGGLGGEAEYEDRFEQQAAAIAQAATRAGAAQDNVVVLNGENARRDALRRELASFVGKAKKEDQVVVAFVGHGSFDGEDYRFNIPGPDITGREIATLLDKLPAGQQLVVNATSSSGAVAEIWKRPNRIVITATKSGGERNATRFAQYWVEALSSAEADRDKNETVTVEEAYEFAARRVADTFKADAALATEHSRIDGPSPARFVVARLGSSADLPSDAALADMMKEQTGIEQRIDELKGRKATLAPEQYYDELEKILIELAQLDRRIDERKATLTGTQPREADASKTP
jgi:Peptidase C13 family